MSIEGDKDKPYETFGMSLDELLQWYKDREKTHILTDAELREHMISFAWGNVSLHNPSVTGEMIERAYDNFIEEKRARLNGPDAQSRVELDQEETPNGDLP